MEKSCRFRSKVPSLPPGFVGSFKEEIDKILHFSLLGAIFEKMNIVFTMKLTSVLSQRKLL